MEPIRAADGSDPWIKPRPISTQKIAWAMAGALLLGAVVPSVLVWVHNEGRHVDQNDAGEWVAGSAWNIEELGTIMVMAAVMPGLGTMILTGAFYGWMRRSFAAQGREERHLLLRGTLFGGVLAFVNVPGYLVVELLPPEPFMKLRVGALFLITGAVCGWWIAWQVYREQHPERGFFPRFSLQTLVLLSLGWGLLAFLFMPIPISGHK